MITLKTLRRVLTAAVAASVASAAPGLPAYAAAAEVVRLQTGSMAQSPRVAAIPFAGAGLAPSAFPSLAAPSLSAGLLPGAAPSAASPAALPAAAALPSASIPALLPSAAPAPAPALAPAPAPSAASAAPRSVNAASREVTSALNAAGDLASAAPSSLRGLGEKLEAALTGAPALARSADLAEPSAGLFGELSERGGHLARPAGELIRLAAEAHDGPTAPMPPSEPSRQSPKGPFWPKLLAAGLALAPAYFLGLPLIAGGAAVLGGLTIAGSAALAVTPFLSESAPKALRALPGVMVGGLGIAAAVSGFVAPGLFAAVGGWGLVRYGLGKSNLPRYESIESLSAYFGGVAALTGAALAAAHPAGWLALGVRYVAYPVSALLWLHLPSWVGEGMGSVFQNAWLSLKGLNRVMISTRRDTTLFERLDKFSVRQLDASKWNGVWLAVIWAPIVLTEAAKWVAGGVAGLYAGAIQAPVMFLWGASYKLFGAGKAAAYFAEAARFAFDRIQNGKAGVYNKAEALVLPYANSEKLAARAAGSLGLLGLQLGWLAFTAIGTPLLTVAGLIFAFGRMGTYDAGRHAPSSLRINTDDSPGTKPNVPNNPTPTTPGKSPLAPKLIAMALALAPAVYFGLPLLTGTLFHAVGILYALLVLPLAAMPFIGPRTPKFLKSLAAYGLEFNGALLFFSGHAVIAGLIAMLGGWGFRRYAASRDDGKERSFDDASELGAFFGALGSAVAIGAAWMGLAGPWGWAALGLAAVTSPFLLMHLPEYVFSGVLKALRQFPDSIKSYADVLGFWHDDSKFMANLRRHADYWLGKTYWNGVWLSLIWVPTGLIAAAEYLVSIALGLATGLIRVPLAYLAGASKKSNPDGRLARFSGAALDGWSKSAEDSKPFFDRMISGLKPAMNQSSAVSGRPTATAALAFLGARFVQLGWLIGVLAMNVTGAALAVGLYRGARAAFAPKPVEKN